MTDMGTLVLYALLVAAIMALEAATHYPSRMFLDSLSCLVSGQILLALVKFALGGFLLPLAAALVLAVIITLGQFNVSGDRIEEVRDVVMGSPGHLI